MDYPIIADVSREIAISLGALDPELKERATGLPVTVRAVYIIGPDKKLKLELIYPPSCGRNFYEIVRVIDSLQLSAYQSCATPANWRVSAADEQRACAFPSLSDEAATAAFGSFEKAELPSGKGYLRFVVPKPTVVPGK